MPLEDWYSRPSKNTSASARLVIAALCVAAAALASGARTEACAVPVHRYMLERWESEFYPVYYFYRGEENQSDREVNQFLEDAGSSFGSHINLYFRSVDADTLSTQTADSEAQYVWKEYGSDQTPFHLVLTPLGSLLFRGRLELKTAKAMIHSPMKTRIARELCSRQGGLLLLLAGSSKEENDAAEKAVHWVLERAKKEHGLDVGFLTLSRKDSREEWLVRLLLDLVEEPPEKQQCMVFGICGRARILAACLGEGITRRNILDCVGLMNGDCSCDLRMANPGMDLLTDCDWDAAVANLPPLMEEPLQSFFLGFDDLEESEEVSPREEEKSVAKKPEESLRRRNFTGWAIAFAIASVVVVGIGFFMMKRRKEL